MFPDDVQLRGAMSMTSGSHGRGEQPRSTDRNGGGGGGGGGLAVVAVGGQRGTLYDSFELNAMVARLNRVLNAGGAGGSGSGGARRPRKPAGSWLAAPKVLFRKIKSALVAGRRGDG